MARIKLASEGWEAFGPGVTNKQITPPRDYMADTLNTINAVKGVTQIAEEGVGVLGKGLDWLTEVGAFGKGGSKEAVGKEAEAKTKEALMAEAAKKRAEMVAGHEAEVKRMAELQKGPSTQPEPTEVSSQIKGSQDIQKTLEALKAGQATPEQVKSSIDNALKVGSITSEQAKALTERTGRYFAAASAAEKEATSVADKAHAEKGNRILADYKTLDDQKNEYLAGRGAWTPQQEAMWQRAKDAVKNYQKGTPDYSGVAASRARAIQAGFAGEKAPTTGSPITEGTFTGVENIVNAIPKDRAETLYATLTAIPELQRTTQQQQLLNAIRTKYSDLLPAGTTREGEAYEVEKGLTKPADEFVRKLEDRKNQIKQRIDLTVEEKQKAIENLDATLADASKNKQPISEVIANRALTGKHPLFPADQMPKTEAEVKAKRDELAAQLAELTSPKKVQEIQDREQTRTDVVKNTAASIIDATVQLQALNAQRAKRGLTADEASKVIQLENYIRENGSRMKGIMASQIDDPEFKSLVTEANEAVRVGKLPTPETAEQREQHFRDALSIFDEEQKKIIEQKAKEAGVKASDGVISADELKLMAASAAINSDEKMASRILGILASGQIVGIAPRKFTDLFNGDHKKAFNDEIIKTLFTRAKGKSDEELAATAARLNLQAMNAESQFRAREAGIKEKEQRLKEAQATEEDRASKIKSEAEIAASKSKQESMKSSEEALDASLDILKSKAATGKFEAENLQKVLDSKLRLQRAQAGYFGSRLGVEMKKLDAQAQREAKDSLEKVGGEMEEGMSKAEQFEDKQHQALGYYSKFVKNGRLDETAFKKDFPDAPTAKSSQADKDKYNAAVKNAGGPEQYAKNKSAITNYLQKVQGGGETAETVSEAKKSISYVKSALSDVRSKLAKIKVTDSAFGDKTDIEREKLIKLQKVFSDIQARAGSFSSKKSEDVKETIDAILKE